MLLIGLALASTSVAVAACGGSSTAGPGVPDEARQYPEDYCYRGADGWVSYKDKKTGCTPRPGESQEMGAVVPACNGWNPCPLQSKTATTDEAPAPSAPPPAPASPPAPSQPSRSAVCRKFAEYVSNYDYIEKGTSVQAYDTLFHELQRSCPSAAHAAGMDGDADKPPCRRPGEGRTTCQAFGDPYFRPLSTDEILAASSG
jgi:hypothetical protein